MRLWIPLRKSILAHRNNTGNIKRYNFPLSISSSPICLYQEVGNITTGNNNNNNKMGRRCWITTTKAGVASSIALAALHNSNEYLVNGFVPNPSFMGNSCLREQRQSLLFSTAAPVSEAADEASSTDVKASSPDAKNVPGQVLYQSHQLFAIKMLLNEDSPLNQNDKKESSPIDPVINSGTGMFQKGGVDMLQKSKKQAEGVSDFTGKTVTFENGATGVIVAQRPPIAFCLMKQTEGVDIPSLVEEKSDKPSVSIDSKAMTVPVSESMIGQVLDCFGEVIHDYNIDTTTDRSDDDVISDRAIFASIPQVKDIALINEPMLSGSLMIDALAPIGKGQNMLIVGEEGTGERDMLLDMMKMQLESHEKKKIVYALTTTDASVRKLVLETFEKAGILKDIVVVTMRDTDNHDVASKSAEAVTVAGTACSIAEAFSLTNGDDALVIVDNINSHKNLWDWSTRVLVDVYGLDAVVKDDLEGGASSEMRGFYSSLIQRAGKFKQRLGGGSVTSVLLNLLPKINPFTEDENDMVFSESDFTGSSEKIKERIGILVKKNIPLTPSTLRKIQIPVPVTSDSEKERRLAVQHSEDLISMTDGQIWLDETLYQQGQRPAVDPQRSLTRVGIGADTESRADAPAMRGLSGGLRFDFAQASAVDGAEANSGADKLVLKKKAYLLAMHQKLDERRKLSENCVALLAASNGSLNDIIQQGCTAGTEAGGNAINGLLKHVQTEAPAAMKEIDDTLDMSASVREKLEAAIKSYNFST